MFYMKLGRGKIVASSACAESFSWHAYCQASLARRERKTLTDFHYKNIFEFLFFSLWKIFIFIGSLSGGGGRRRGLGTQVIDISEWIVFLAKKPHFQQRRNDWWSAQQLSSHWPKHQVPATYDPLLFDVENKIFFFRDFPGVFLFCFSNTNFFSAKSERD